MGLLLFGLLISFLNTSSIRTPVKEFHINGYAQGTTYHITYYARDSMIAARQIDSIFKRIDSALSLYKENSIINQFNASEDGMIIRSGHFTSVVNYALRANLETNGLFDMTVYPLTAAWGFGPKKPDSLPDSATILQLLPCVGSSLIEWQGNKLVKKKPCVKLDPNGIAQGYTVDFLALFFNECRIQYYIIEVGGELRVKGPKPDDKKFSIGIEAPTDDPGTSLMKKIIYLESGSITTSGNYRKYYESNGKKISHLLNPKTGYPVDNELISVTVYSKYYTITADAYDNAMMAMGLEDALDFVEQHPDIAAYFIYKNKNGTISDTASKKFTALFQP
jgi:thiamine biosynthesis lipoprotein